MKIQGRDILSLIFALIATFVFISIKFDIQISNFFVSLRTPLLTDILTPLTFISSGLIVGLFIIFIFLWTPRKREWILPLGLTCFLSAVIAFLLKIGIQRARPFDQGINAISLVIDTASGWWNYSFPSFRTLIVFAVLPILQKEYKKFKYIWIIFAVIVGFSRVYFGMHFLSDVIAGAIIGYLIGLFVLKLDKDLDIGRKFNRIVYRKFKGI